jgi:hypothetical protein
LPQIHSIVFTLHASHCEDEGSLFLQNSDKYQSDYMALHTRTPSSLCFVSTLPEVWQCKMLAGELHSKTTLQYFCLFWQLFYLKTKM